MTKERIFRLHAAGKEGGAFRFDNTNFPNEIKQTFTSPDSDGRELHQTLSSLKLGQDIYLIVPAVKATKKKAKS